MTSSNLPLRDKSPSILVVRILSALFDKGFGINDQSLGRKRRFIGSGARVWEYLAENAR